MFQAAHPQPQGRSWGVGENTARAQLQSWVCPGFVANLLWDLGKPFPSAAPQFPPLQNKRVGLPGSSGPPGRWHKDRACPRKAIAFRSLAHMGGRRCGPMGTAECSWPCSWILSLSSAGASLPRRSCSYALPKTRTGKRGAFLVCSGSMIASMKSPGKVWDPCSDLAGHSRRCPRAWGSCLHHGGAWGLGPCLHPRT